MDLMKLPEGIPKDWWIWGNLLDQVLKPGRYGETSQCNFQSLAQPPQAGTPDKDD